MKGGKRDWEQCAGSGQPARWIPHPFANGIEMPICSFCGKNGFRAVNGGAAPPHVELGQEKKRDVQDEYQRRKERHQRGEDIRL